MAAEQNEGISRLSRFLKIVGAGVSIVFIGVIALHLIFGVNVTQGGRQATGAPNFPKGGPAEFLYLDSNRVAAYLAQINGGSYSDEKQTNKLTENLNGKLNFEGAVEAGASKQEEEFVERKITSTAATSFFALYSAIKKQHEVKRIHLSHFKAAVEPLPEGQFVSFKTEALLSPVYLNSYLATRRPHGLRELFPPDGRNGVPPHATPERRSAWKLKGEVGRDPRVIFSLHSGRKGHERQFVYLLPMSAELLTEEQSLLARGGGKFTVVGKLVRIFPGGKGAPDPAYVDSATLQTWEGALRSAPGELICRTEPRCVDKVRGNQLRGNGRDGAIKSARRRELRALSQQTEIEKRGAVIIPIAIYK